MIRICLSIFGCIFLLVELHAQDVTQVDRYLQSSEQATTDSARANNLWQAAFNCAHSDPKRGIEIGHRALAIGLKTENKKLIADCHNSIGYCFDSSGSADSALFHYQESIRLLLSSGHKCESAGVYANIGTLQKRRNQLTEALSSFLQAYDIQKDCPDLGYHGSTLYSIGSCYNAMENFEKALEYFRLSLQKEVENGNKAKQGLVHNGMANAYSGLGDYGKSIASFRESLRLQPEGNLYEKAYAYEGISQVFDKMNQMDSAVYYCSEARDIFLELNVPFDLVYESTLLAGYYVKMKRWEEAEKLLLATLPVSEKENLPYDRLNILASLADVFEMKGDYRQAFEYLDKSMLLRDSLKLDEQKANMAELAGKYETEARDRQIALEQEKNRRLELQKYVFLGGAIFLFLLALILINRYLSKQRTARELAEKNIQIEKEKKRAEDSEKVKQQFLANMSHEIRTPMNAITGLSRRLRSLPLDERSREYADAIHHSSQNLMVILNDILDLSKIEAGKMVFESVPFRPYDEMKQCIQVFASAASEKGLKLKLSADDIQYLVVKGDPARFSQVLNNLVSNAVKFTVQGEVIISGRMVSSQDENVKLKFAVSDDGPGIPEDKQRLIFESFTQANISDSRKHGGTGLGLTIASELIRIMQGKLELESTPGKGSTFSFIVEMPATDALPETSEAHFNASERAFHALVAEDNDYNYLVTADTMKHFFPAAKLYRAHNGEEALKMLDEDDYDLVIMDIQMPGIDGYEATMQLRKKGNEVPVIGFTASVIQEDLDRCMESGMNSVLMKPFRDEDFVKTISGAIRLQPVDGSVKSGGDSVQRDLFFEFMPARIDELSKLIITGSVNDVKRWMHTVRPQLHAVGLEELAELAVSAEMKENESEILAIAVNIQDRILVELRKMKAYDE
ncbi:MAG: hypothetical protein RL220_2000 [Bacteroidota bacterium]